MKIARAQKLLTGIIVLSMLIPVVYGEELFPLLRTNTRFKVVREFTSVRVRTTIMAPYKKGCTPNRAIKWTLYKRDIYGRWQFKKTGYFTVKYYMIVTLNGLKWKGVTNKYFFNLNLGDYKYKVKSYDGCAYRAVRGQTGFVVKWGK